MNVAVGISGGVDSAVAAVLCKKMGHNVIGVTMKIWNEMKPHEKSDTSRHACFGPEEEQDIDDAKKICETIGIPLHVIDCTEEFEKKILSYFSSTYMKGKTPNPCVYCNQQLKFGLLPELLLKQQKLPIDFFATGHYALIEYASDGAVHLMQAFDAHKDQSYFLYRLSHQQLRKSLLPLGNLTKKQVREIARESNLHVWDKDESQDFYSGDYRTLIEKSDESVNYGLIKDVHGRILGEHNGVWNFTVGQRKGLGITSSKPMYVTGIDAVNNEVTVGERDYLKHIGIVISEFNQLEPLPDKCLCKVRSSAQFQPCSIFQVNNSQLKILFDSTVSGICPGQSAVLYSGGVVLGGGVIEKHFN